MNGLRRRRPTCRDLRWLAHEQLRWRRQYIGGQTELPTGGKNRVHNVHNKMDMFIKEATENKPEKQKLLN